MKKHLILTGIILFLGGLMPTSAQNKNSVKEDFAGYLFAYFEGNGDKQEHLRFALSENATDWYALNENRPIISSDTISESGGIRDPHILRGEDGCYYIVATDMHTFDPAQGWGRNPGIVLLKSSDLINWNHSKINLSQDFPKNFGDAFWVWAPQTIYDHQAQKYMIYFTLQRNDRKTLITYYAYANKDFTGFESEPRQLFAAKYGSIDNDIIYKDGRYHLFYKGNTKDENGREYINGIQQATSHSIHGPWKEDFKYLDAYAGRTPVEGSGIFKLNGREEYVLMYDLYTNGRYEYQTSTDLYHFTKEPKSFSKNFFPRHGTVCSVTAEELERLQQKWGRVLKQEPNATVISHPWSGKKVAYFGDSITDPRNKASKMKYWGFLEEWLGITPLVYGVSGRQWNDIPRQANKLKEEHGNDFDAILIFMGTNDYNNAVPIGQWFDEKIEDVEYGHQYTKRMEKRMRRYPVMTNDTYRGRINIAMDSLKRMFPTKQIVLLTPIHRAGFYANDKNWQCTEDYVNRCGEYLDAYVESVKEAGNLWAVPVIDLNSLCGLYPMIEAHMSYFKDKQTDGLHPNDAGHQRMARTLMFQLSALPCVF